MKRRLILLFFLASFFAKANAQCNNNISPVPKSFGKHWPYNMRPATECELIFFQKVSSLLD